MNEPFTEWPKLIGELNAAGITPYKLTQMLNESGCRCQFVQIQRLMNGGRAEYHIGTLIKRFHSQYAVPHETLRT